MSSLTEQVAQPLGLIRGTPRTVIGIALAVTFLSLGSSWWSFLKVWYDLFPHGFIVAGFCLWQLSKLQFDGTAVVPQRLALLPLAGLSLLWMAAIATNIQSLHQLAAPLILLTWTLAVFGERTLGRIVPIAAVFMLALPIAGFLAGPLRALTVVATGAMLKLTSLQAVIDGDIIRIPAGTFVVERGCAGLGFLMSGLTIGAMYTFLIPMSRSARAAIILAAAGTSIVSNWVRVFGLVVIGHVTNMQSSLMKGHAIYGWVIFALSLPAFFFVARRLESWRPSSARQPNDVTPNSRSEQSSRGLRRLSLAALVAATAVAAVGPSMFLVLHSMPPRAADAGIQGLAAAGTLSGMTESGRSPSGDSSPLEMRWAPAFVGASDHRVATSRTRDREVQVDRLLFQDQSQGHELINDGNRIAPDSLLLSDRAVGPLDSTFRIVRQAVVRAPHGVRIVWYWYRVAGIETPSAIKAKLLELLVFVTRGPASELVAVSAACGTNDCRDGEAALRALVLGDAAPVRR